MKNQLNVIEGLSSQILLFNLDPLAHSLPSSTSSTLVWISRRIASFRAQTPVSAASLATTEVFPPEVLEHQVVSRRVCDKWLKDRWARQLSRDDLTVYQKVVVALKETIRLMEEVDSAVGEWPLE